MSSDIWNPWHGCRKYSEGCDHCYMYYLDNERGKSGGEIYKVKTNSGLLSCSYFLFYQISPTDSIASWLKIVHPQTIWLCKRDGFSAAPPVNAALIRQVHRPILLRNPR